MATNLNKTGTYAFYGILASVEKALKDPANRKDFENWYRKSYGKEYVWKIYHLEDNGEDTYEEDLYYADGGEYWEGGRNYDDI